MEFGIAVELIGGMRLESCEILKWLSTNGTTVQVVVGLLSQHFGPKKNTIKTLCCNTKHARISLRKSTEN